MDTSNPVVRLCAQGMAAEARGLDAEARALFEQAWQLAGDDYEACVAAHYLARHQDGPEATLRWNETCLRHADKVGDERVAGFYCSLHANIARSHRALANTPAARRHFELAADHLAAVPQGPYRDWLRYSVAEGLRDTGPPARANHPRIAVLLEKLLDGFCARRDLRSLCLLLPAYLGDLGGDDDAERLATHARMLHAEKRLSEHEQAMLSEVIEALPG
ncbi:hypothetical protein SacmaDRAFT_1805 [Saccharomonospora marina XMU15]|uniref:Tetratricopeptide repeat protein n=1 Tax=Saccharomonospora marina XMU15 TaxID=882083 RepID=H5X5K2_9PSEU|nr:hypothetical protein [Saccharomonospora marina]EHR50074.1 hypothetical protein SacmaDRAFT_1805 [Saccharomonospora marina XMU15]